MRDAWSQPEHRPSLSDVLIAQYETGWDGVGIEALIVIHALAAARDRRIGDGHEGVLVEGCRRTIELFRHIIEARHRTGLNKAELETLAMELAEWARDRRSVREFAERWLFTARASIFGSDEYTHGIHALSIHHCAIVAHSEDVIEEAKDEDAYEPIIRTLNRAVAFIEAVKYQDGSEDLIDLHLAVMACKRLGSELLDWRY
ncbi:hypothetical protein MZO42_10965 [Sphingomonas psychrotolerans]|uniref:Uncharacterized protein n=1 Tax=Sphingomonas psychrotolerans TaxID=1327635 RepID=A0ABU3N4B2_9SPHN|nr:hypothetical protein [Sphingomonas psychrotolerans]MDT8759218.1 hypothetical protein [Sphingomonas psychrotolerans]